MSLCRMKGILKVMMGAEEKEACFKGCFWAIRVNRMDIASLNRLLIPLTSSQRRMLDCIVCGTTACRIVHR